jgi:hypothetical protein
MSPRQFAIGCKGTVLGLLRNCRSLTVHWCHLNFVEWRLSSLDSPGKTIH